MRTKVLCWLLGVCMLIAMLPMSVAAETTGAPAETGYFQAQLLTKEARTIYSKIGEMDLQSGADSFTLENVPPENQYAMLTDFMAARDAYMLDHNLFYVDFDKMAFHYENGTVTIGIGSDNTRYDNYLQDGFTADTVADAINELNAAVDTIVVEANKKDTMQKKVKAAYDAVIGSCSYALETEVKTPGNEYHVRTAYGALVTGEAVCAGYARAVKAVLDKMGIENVLVQGVYDDGTYTGPHMWNAVRMDDHRWYMLDATMEDGLRESTDNDNESESYFLVTGLDELMDDYQPNGVVSASATSDKKSMEFSYPDLSIKEYEDLSTAFEVVGKDAEYNYYDLISYKSMGLAAAQATTMTDSNGDKQPIYILSSLNGTVWYYYERVIQHQMYVMGKNEGALPPQQTISMYDSPSSFTNFGHAYFGVTTVAPAIEYDSKWTKPEEKKQYYIYEGGLANVHDVSLVGTATTFEKVPPYITEKIPYNSRLDQGKTYEVTVTYSEPLKKANSAREVNMTWVEKVNNAAFTNFQWWGDDKVAEDERNDAKVTFTVTTGTNFGRTTNYYFELQNLVGTESGKAPNAIGFSTYNNNVFDCPKVDWDVSKIHADTPVLIDNEDLSTDGWTDAEGKPLGNLPKRLALVASTIDAAKSAEMISKINSTNVEVKASQTYDISLTLCSGEVGYLNGKAVQVYVPFPAGYSYADYTAGNTTFKAYHFDKDSTPEEITCKVVEGGIIMYCTRFSPFAVVALAGTGDTIATVSSVVVSPSTVNVQKGSTQKFDVSVTGTGSFDSTVIWTVEGGVSGTVISQDGLLTVASTETATALTVKATANGDQTKTGTATVTVTAIPVTKYSVTVTNGIGDGEYEAGAVVTITADAPEEGYQFKEWTGVDGLAFVDETSKTSATAKFTMPNRAVTVTAVYEEKPDKDQDTTRLDAWYYDVMMLFSQQFTIQSVASDGGSIVSAQGDKVFYDRSRTVKIVPEAGYEIVSVIVDGEDLGAIPEYTFKRVKANHRIEAVFAQIGQAAGGDQ